MRHDLSLNAIDKSIYLTVVSTLLAHLIELGLIEERREVAMPSEQELQEMDRDLRAMDAERDTALRRIAEMAHKGANGGLKVPGKADSVSSLKTLLRQIRNIANEADTEATEPRKVKVIKK